MARSRYGARLRPLIALTLAALVLIGACANPMTINRYAAGDGARADLGSQIKVENLLIVSEAVGSPGTLLGGIVNEWAQDTQVTLRVEGTAGATTLDLTEGETLLLQPDDEAGLQFAPANELVILPSVPVAPGAMVEVQVSTDQSGSITLPVPVLDASVDPYGQYLPSVLEQTEDA